MAVTTRTAFVVCIVVLSCATLSAAFSVGSPAARLGLRTQGFASCSKPAPRSEVLIVPADILPRPARSFPLFVGHPLRRDRCPESAPPLSIFKGDPRRPHCFQRV